MEMKEFDFGFWTEEVDNAPRNDRELLQRVRHRLSSGEATLDLLTDREYELLLASDLRRFVRRALRGVQLSTAHKDKTRPRSKHLVQFLRAKCNRETAKARKVSCIHATNSSERENVRRVIRSSRSKCAALNRKRVRRIQLLRRRTLCAMKKCRIPYNFTPVNVRIELFMQLLHKLDEQFKCLCRQRQAQLQEKLRRAIRFRNRWNLFGKGMRLFRGPCTDLLLAFVYGNQWRIKYRSSEQARLLEMSTQVETDIHEQADKYLEKAGHGARKASEVCSEKSTTSTLPTTEHDTVDAKFLGLSDKKSVKITQNLATTKHDAKVGQSEDQSATLGKTGGAKVSLSFQKTPFEYSNWNECYHHEQQQFQQYLQLAFELGIRDSSITLQEMRDLKERLAQPKLLNYKHTAPSKRHERVRKQLEMEIRNLTARRRKVVPVPPKYPIIVAKANTHLFRKSKSPEPVECTRVTPEICPEVVEDRKVEDLYLTSLFDILNNFDISQHRGRDIIAMSRTVANTLLAASEPEVGSAPERRDQKCSTTYPYAARQQRVQDARRLAKIRHAMYRTDVKLTAAEKDDEVQLSTGTVVDSDTDRNSVVGCATKTWRSSNIRAAGAQCVDPFLQMVDRKIAQSTKNAARYRKIMVKLA